MASGSLLCLTLFAVTTHAMALSLRNLDEGVDDACSGCELTVDLRCAGIRSQRGQPYHRIQDCLLPLYGLVKMAEDESNTNNTNVCAVTWQVNYEGLNLTQFLWHMSSANWYKIIDEREACSKNLDYHTVNRTEKQMAKAGSLLEFGKDKHMIKAYSIDYSWNLQWLQKDAKRLEVPGKLPHILIIHRKHRNTVGSDRSFREEAFEDLSGSMHKHTGLPITTYQGNESVVDTVRLWQKSAGVIGYHGAAWANTYFISRPHCNVQISTFYDLESTLPWRTSPELAINPSGTWYFYHLPLKIVLDANHVPHKEYVKRTEKDHFIKDLDWVPLRALDIADMTSHMVECLKDPRAYNRSHQNASNVTASQGWNTSSWNTSSRATSFVTRFIPTDKQFSAVRDNCTGCDFTVDLRCDGFKYARHQYFNRVVHCLLPMYKMIQLAREAASNESAHVCAITWMEAEKNYSKLDLLPFLTEFVAIPWYTIIDENSECANSSMYYAAKRTNETYATDEYMELFGRDRHMIRSYPIDLKLNLAWLQADAVNMARRPTPTFILLQNTDFNKFRPEDVKTIDTKISAVTGRFVITFKGTESLGHTVRLFTNAGGIIGFSGVTWANDLFASYPHCNVQYSTFRDFNKTIPWTNFNISALNPIGNLQFVNLPLYQLLHGNNITPNEYRRSKNPDLMIKQMEWLTLQHSDIIDSVSRFWTCWMNKWIAYRRTIDLWGKSGNNLDE